MNRFKKVLIFLLVVGLAFLVGFGWQYLRARRLADSLKLTADQLSLQRLENTMAAATIEAQRGSYETARRLASDFYTGLQAHVNRMVSADSAQLHAILSQRDETITLLSRGDSQSGESLARQFVLFRRAVGGAAGTLPLGQVQPPAPGTQAAPTGQPAPGTQQQPGTGVIPGARPTPPAARPLPAESMRTDTGGAARR